MDDFQFLTYTPTFIRDTYRTLYATNVIHASRQKKLGGESTVTTEYCVADHSSQWQALETIVHLLPQPNIVPAFAFIIESMDTVDGRTFFVASEEKHVVWIFDLQCEE